MDNNYIILINVIIKQYEITWVFNGIADDFVVVDIVVVVDDIVVVDVVVVDDVSLLFDVVNEIAYDDFV